VTRSSIAGVALAIVLLTVSAIFASWLWSYQNDRIGPALGAVERAADPAAVPTPISLDKQLDLQRDLLKIELDARPAVIQIVLAAGAIGTATFALLNYVTAQRNLRVAEQTLESTQQGQVTERFTRAIDQLGAVVNEQPNLEVRLGGIYALEGIAQDAPEYRVVVTSVLSAYVRQNAQIGRIDKPLESEYDSMTRNNRPREDVAATLDTLGRFSRDAAPHTRPSLEFTDFTGLDLTVVC
jgi:hypothetical protein